MKFYYSSSNSMSRNQKCFFFFCLCYFDLPRFIKTMKPPQNRPLDIQCTINYYPTALHRVQITPKTSTNITRYLYSRGLVREVFLVLLLLTNQLAGFPAPIPFRLAYFCHAFSVNKCPRNLPSRT